MQLLEDRIRCEGVVYDGEVLKVDSFLNHQMDVAFFGEMAKEFARLYSHCDINKILTIEASGIGLACITAQQFGCPVVFAKKAHTSNLDPRVWTASVKSYTHGKTYDIQVARQYLGKGDRVLIIDDFLAMGEALNGLIKLVNDSGATLVGCGVAVEKAFQPGGAQLRAKGIRVESLARVSSMSVEHGIEFVR